MVPAVTALHFPVQLELHHSRRLMVLLLTAYGLAGGAVLFASWPLWWSVSLLGVLAANLVVAMRREADRSGHSLVLDASGWLTVRDGRETLVSQPVVEAVDFGWAMWLKLPATGTMFRARRVLVLLPDHVGHANWRILRVWVRHCACAPAARVDATGQP